MVIVKQYFRHSCILARLQSFLTDNFKIFPQPQILYNYCSKNRIDILRNREIRLIQPGVLNDPFEMRPYISKIASLENYGTEIINTVPGFKEKYPSIDDFFRHVKNNPDDKWLKVQSLDSEIAKIVRTKMAKYLNETTGILCLTEDPLSLLMWAHYGSSHTGFVIGFNTSDDFFKRTNGWDGLKRVQYSKTLPNETLADVTNKQILLTKSCDWCYEREWRLLRHLEGASNVLNDKNDKIYLFKVPPSCIDSVLLGCKSKLFKQIKNILATIKDYAHVKLYKAKQSEKLFALSMERI